MKELFPAGITGIIYDCDGVMIESAAANRHLYNLVLARLNLPPMTDAQTRYAFQATFMDAMKFLVPPELHDSINDAVASAVNYDSDILPRIQLMPGYREFVEKAHKHGLRQAIDTNRTDIGIEKIIARFKLPRYFEPVISSSVVARPKPFPDGVDKIRETWGCAANQMLFVGDSPDDRAAAESGGAIFVSFGDNGAGGALQVTSWDQLAHILWRASATHTGR